MSLFLASLSDLFDTSDFPARWNCGRWSPLHGWFHIVSDIAIAAAYSMIPLALATYWWLKRSELVFPKLFWLFSAFIFSCGATHLTDAVIFYSPVYRFSALMKVITALVSWATVVALFRIAPKALELPGLHRAHDLLQRQHTATRQAEDALARSNRDLAAFTGLVTHDLRNPLNNALMLTEMAREATSSGKPEDVLVRLELATHSLRQMEALIRELHADSMVRVDPGELARTDLGGVIEAARLHLAPLISQTQARIEVTGVPALPAVSGNHTMLVQLFINLFENSIKYRNGEAPLISVTGDQQDGRVGVQVTDNGRGIAEADVDQIFQSGVRGGNVGSTPGSGLGLAFCRRIMDMHGGKIAARSQKDGGARFELLFDISPS
ncbi:HAMP domain-containing sensor histidine kinase [Haloferula sp. BvORR071]|uniref:sensor histidine kinase n=1 Tax=Haloferula sp. BvORR071 TaxID=1396141 RepID=UPI0005504D45|nr:HAMP domain-containing sensor histidine kinase [Haloferula sp. BvORR071]